MSKMFSSKKSAPSSKPSAKPSGDGGKSKGPKPGATGKKPSGGPSGATSKPSVATTSGGAKKGVVKSFAVSEDRNSRHRRTMEDQHIMTDGFGGDPNTAFFAVFDGHGGKQAAEFCKAHFSDILGAAYKAAPSDPGALWEKVYTETDVKMKEAQVMYSGTTSVTAFIKQKGDTRTLYMANAGDARGILARSGSAKRMTFEHKPSDPAEAKRVEAAGGFIINNRVNGILAITRSLGDLLMKDYVVGTPYVETAKLAPGDTHVILACDGVWDVMEDQDAVDICKAEADPQAAADKIVREALSKGTTDNVTVIVIVL